jgi:hypothetical protein
MVLGMKNYTVSEDVATWLAPGAALGFAGAFGVNLLLGTVYGVELGFPWLNFFLVVGATGVWMILRGIWQYQQDETDKRIEKYAEDGKAWETYPR